MMKAVNFTKMVASGNDFIVIRLSRPPVSSGMLSGMAKNFCDRKFGIGADGLLVLEKSRVADIKMRIFNADGSEAEMCGNGARCIALWMKSKLKKSKINIETKAGIIESEAGVDSVRIKLTEPKFMKLNVPIKVSNRQIRINFINTGVPHAVIFVEGLDKINATGLGRQIRYHKRFSPKGTNVDFVEVLNRYAIDLRTYERGVEDETLACGTGAVASALIFALKTNACKKIDIHTRSKEVLAVYFRRLGNKFTDVWLQGKVNIVFEGVSNLLKVKIE